MTERELAARARQGDVLARRGLGRECCRDAQNLETIEEHHGSFKTTCTVCGLRHYRLEADPGRIMTTGRDL